MDDANKLVHFDHYCYQCKHFSKEPWEDPCHECLSIPARRDSHKPERFVLGIDLSKAEENSQKKQGL